MGEAARIDRQPGYVSHAGGGPAASADAARSAVKFAADALGATAIEYGLIAALISVAIIGALAQLSGQMDAMYTSIVNAMP
jgi:pilus assembly protein Flp/PilA